MAEAKVSTTLGPHIAPRATRALLQGHSERRHWKAAGLYLGRG